MVRFYEGTDPEKAKEARRILSESRIEIELMFGNYVDSRKIPFPIVAKGMAEYCDLGAIRLFTNLPQ